MKFISFFCYKNYFYFLVFWILELSVSILNNFIYKLKAIKLDDELVIDDDLKDEYIELISLNIADLLAGFLVLYTKYSLPKKEKRSISKGEIELIYKGDPVNNNKKVLYLIVISISDFVARSLFFWFSLFINKRRVLFRSQFEFLNGLDICFRYFCSKIFLKTKIYKHHLWAIIITIIGFVSMSVLDVISIIEDKENSGWDKKMFILFILPRSFFFPLEDVINKILLSDDFLLPHSLMFRRGIIEFVLIFIMSLILFSTGQLNLDYNNKNIPLIILIKSIYIIIYFAKAFCLMKIIYIYTSQYVSFLVVSEQVAGTLNIIINNVYGEEVPSGYSENNIFIIIEILSLIIVTFGTLMYNEIIVINKCGLHEKTKNFLLLKGEEEFIISSMEVDDENNDVNKKNDNNKNKAIEMGEKGNEE